jgi:hypothetical protein
VLGFPGGGGFGLEDCPFVAIRGGSSSKGRTSGLEADVIVICEGEEGLHGFGGPVAPDFMGFFFRVASKRSDKGACGRVAPSDGAI